jgi:RNAse (barnase) inhibitor barstar
MDLDLWPLIDALMTWVIIPITAMLWVHNQKLAAHDRDVLRIVTLLAERKDQRDEDRAELNDALRDLRAAIQRLDQRLADIALAQSAQAAATARDGSDARRRDRG